MIGSSGRMLRKLDGSPRGSENKYSRGRLLHLFALSLSIAIVYSFLVLSGSKSAIGAQEPRSARTRIDQTSDQDVPEGILNLVERANRFASMGRCEDAVPILERVVRDYPRVAIAVELLSNCYIKSGKAADASRLLEEAVNREPTRFQYLKMLGLAYIDLGRRKEASETWRRALRPEKEYAQLYGFVAKLEQEAGLYEEALETYRAGSAFTDYRDYYAREIIRLERLLGRQEDALRDLLRSLKGREELGEADVAAALGIYNEAENRSRLVAIADSAARESSEEVVPKALQLVFLLEDGRIREAREAILRRGPRSLGEKGLYVVLKALSMASVEHSSPENDKLLRDMCKSFQELYPQSPLVPAMLMMLAEGALDRSSRESGSTRKESLDYALSMATAAREHRLGAPYAERATLLIARTLLEKMFKPDDAIRELDSKYIAASRNAPAVEMLRVKALLASSDSETARKRILALSADSDTVLSIIGMYGLGELAFRNGSYAEASRILSELAEKHPGNSLANDALGRAIEIAEGMKEGTEALDLYRLAIVSLEKGNSDSAMEFLSRLESDFGGSALAPRAAFLSAEIAAQKGSFTEAASRFERLAEVYPWHEMAPRALERLAEMKEAENRERSREIYETIMQRYPGYPFLDRVRAKYAKLLRGLG